MKLRPKTVLSGVPVAVEIYESRPFRATPTERAGLWKKHFFVTIAQNTMARC